MRNKLNLKGEANIFSHIDLHVSNVIELLPCHINVPKDLIWESLISQKYMIKATSKSPV